ncbi:MAG: lactate utilization protein [Firmicutes bacterium]|nr:lactate utilization protein [Bacillota bacterium]
MTESQTEILRNQFQRHFEALGGHVFYAADSELPIALASAYQAMVDRYLPDSPLQVVYWLNSDVSALNLEEILGGIRRTRCMSWPQGGSQQAIQGRWQELLAASQVGITGAAWAAADTGTVALCASPSTGLLPSLLMPVHIMLLNQNQIQPSVSEGLKRLYQDSRKEGRMPPLVKLITGPSMTADIEGQLVIGVHGPGAIGVVVYD